MGGCKAPHGVLRRVDAIALEQITSLELSARALDGGPRQLVQPLVEVVRDRVVLGEPREALLHVVNASRSGDRGAWQRRAGDAHVHFDAAVDTLQRAAELVEPL